jgi:GNAT superfamily N-acetyltransferase
MNAIIRPLTKRDLPAARRIVCSSFGTFWGTPDPENFWADRDYVYSRFAGEHVASFGAELDGELVGSNFATRWGSVGFLGPISVRPDRQGRGIAKSLVESATAQFDAWGIQHAGLFTFAQSALHVALYQKYGFHARFLTAIMAAPAQAAGQVRSWSRYSDLSHSERQAAESACHELTVRIPTIVTTCSTVIATTRSDGSRPGIPDNRVRWIGSAVGCMVRFGVSDGTQLQRSPSP